MGPLDVIVAGELYVDLIFAGLEAAPRFGSEVFAKDFRREIGGGAAITACGLAKLGSNCAVLGVVGDEDGDWYRRQLANAGVDTGEVRLLAGEATALTVAVTNPEDRMFVTYAGANRSFPAWLMEAIAEGRLARARHVHLAYPVDLANHQELIAGIRRNGCTISADVGWHEDWLGDPRAMEFLSRIDLFFPNDAEARRMTGVADPTAMLRKLEAGGLRRTALKRGADGAALLWEGNLYAAGAHPVTPVDTTGAGDCFDAGFLHAWLAGESPEECLRSANICGALSTRAYGGIEGFPDGPRLGRERKR